MFVYLRKHYIYYINFALCKILPVLNISLLLFCVVTLSYKKNFLLYSKFCHLYARFCAIMGKTFYVPSLFRKNNSSVSIQDFYDLFFTYKHFIHLECILVKGVISYLHFSRFSQKVLEDFPLFLYCPII